MPWSRTRRRKVHLFVGIRFPSRLPRPRHKRGLNIHPSLILSPRRQPQIANLLLSRDPLSKIQRFFFSLSAYLESPPCGAIMAKSASCPNLWIPPPHEGRDHPSPPFLFLVRAALFFPSFEVTFLYLPPSPFFYSPGRNWPARRRKAPPLLFSQQGK